MTISGLQFPSPNDTPKAPGRNKVTSFPRPHTNTEHDTAQLVDEILDGTRDCEALALDPASLLERQVEYQDFEQLSQ